MKLNKFKEYFEEHFRRLKEKHGNGEYSWAEGMTRKIARRIATDLARKQIKQEKA